MLLLFLGQDGAPDYTEISYGIGDFGVSYGQYDDYGDNFSITYGFDCGDYGCGVGYYDFSDDGYGGDEDALVFQFLLNSNLIRKLITAIIKPF